MNNLKYTIELDARGKLIYDLKLVRQQMDGITSSLKRSNDKFKEMHSICQKLGNVSLVSVIAGAKAGVESLKGIINSDLGIGFEQSMADLKAITGIVGKDFDKLAESAILWGGC